MYQKTIKLFLFDGDPNSRIICDLSNWNGIAYKIPKNMLKDSTKDKFTCIENTGVYFLFGEEDGIQKVYIGEAENLYKRLLQHLNDNRDSWQECILFTRVDNSLNKAHVKYIENELYQSAIKSARYDVDNSNVPTRSTLSMTEEAEMKEVIDNIKMLTSSLGFKVFIDASTQKRIDKNIFYFKSKAFNATGYEAENGFIVEKGSTINTIEAQSLHDSHRAIRKRLIEQGIIDNNYTFTENYLFSSSSNAGCIVSGYRVSGPQSWKTSNGKTLKEINEN